MGKRYCVPIYLEDSVRFNEYCLPLQELKAWIFDNLLTYKEIVAIIAERADTDRIAISAVRKILNHYDIVIDSETKRKRDLKRAETTRKNLTETYGVTNVFQLEAVKKKAEDTKMERYGDPHFINQSKMEATNTERYGTANYSSTTECREKVRTTNLERYGAAAPAQNAEVSQKMKDTCAERYGADNYFKSEEFRKAQQEEYFKKYPKLTEVYKEAYRDPEKLKTVIEGLEDKTSHGIAEYFGISYASVNTLLARHGLSDIKDFCYNASHYEQELVEFIGEDLCIRNDRSVLDGQEIDIYIPSKRLGIEFNGTYWHSIEVKKDKNYHLNKSKLAEEKGIRLIHIYEYEWQDPEMKEKIKLMLNIALGRAGRRIYARQCEIRQIPNSEAKVLNDKVHLQGHRDAQVTYGLFYQDELVQLMSFSHTHYNRNLKSDNSWEIIRGCPGSNNVVVGGVSKLFSHFVKDYQPEYVFSYCDYNKFNGKSYEELGMKFIGYTGPDMKWIMPDGTVRNRSPRHHNELKNASIGQLFGAGSKKYSISFGTRQIDCLMP